MKKFIIVALVIGMLATPLSKVELGNEGIQVTFEDNSGYWYEIGGLQ